MYSLKICSNGKCSAPEIKTLVGSTFSFDGFRMGEGKCQDDEVFWSSLVGTDEEVCQDGKLVAFADFGANFNSGSTYTLYGKTEAIKGSKPGA